MTKEEMLKDLYALHAHALASRDMSVAISDLMRETVNETKRLVEVFSAFIESRELTEIQTEQMPGISLYMERYFAHLDAVTKSSAQRINEVIPPDPSEFSH